MADPSTVAGGPIAWYEADAIVGLSDGDAVATWPDSSAGGNDATQGTSASRPTYKTAILNGLPVVRFDGTNDFLTSAASSSDPEQTIFVVFKAASVTARNAFRGGSAGTGALQFRTSLTAGNPEFVREGLGSVGTGTTPVGTSAFRVVTGTFSDSGNAYAFYVDGTAAGSGAASVSLTAGRTTTIGRSGNDTANAANGDLAELIVYNSLLSDTDRAAVHSYFQDKYGITVSDYVASGGIPEGTATGAWVFTGTASGQSDREGTATGAWGFTGSATGQSDRTGTATGSWGFAGAATGSTDKTGTATGSWAFTGSATGAAPSLGIPEGVAIGAWGFAGTAAGTADHKGTASGAWSFTGTASGSTTKTGTATGAWAFLGTATGVNPDNVRDITLTATIDAARFTATLEAGRFTASIDPSRFEATVEV